MTQFNIVIPIRYGSTRLPGKALLDIAGKPLIARVYEKALLCGAKKVIIATDDKRIMDVAASFGAEVCLTSDQHKTGTDRISEVVSKYNFGDDQIIVNLQGDEPLVTEDAINTVVSNLDQHKDASISTLATKINNAADVFNPNVVKVLFDNYGFALYFSRAPIPWDRNNFSVNSNNYNFDFKSSSVNYYRHIGLYAYRAHTLKRFCELPQSQLEQAEFLEQLRMLANGSKIHVACIEDLLPKGVDTEEDLAQVRKIYEQQ